MARSSRISSTGRPTSSAAQPASPSMSSGRRSTPSTVTARSQDRWLSPTCSSATRSGSTAKCAASRRCRPIATLHRPMRPRVRVEERLRHDADRVGEVDDPGSRRRAPGRLLGDLQDDGDRPERLGEAARAGRLLAEDAEPVGQRLVDVPGLLAADPELDHDEVGPVECGVAIVGRADACRPADPPEHPARQRRNDLEPAEIRVEERELIDRKTVDPPRESLDELGRIRAAGTDDRDLETDLRGPPSTAGAGTRSHPLTPRSIVYNIITCSPQSPIPGPDR